MTPLDSGKGDSGMGTGIRLTLFAPVLLAEGLDARALPLKATAALAYLAAANGQPVARERLADLLWSRNGPDQARQSLRQALVTLRRALHRESSGASLSDPVPQSLVLKGVSADVARFEALSGCADPADWAQAVALYKAPLLADFPELGEPFDEWLSAERARLQALASATLHKLALHALEAGEPEAAVAAAQRLLGFDNLREDSHRLLMRAYAASGRRSDALRHYAEAAALLKAELGVAPDAATAALADSIRATAAPAAPALVEAQAVNVAFAPPVRLATPARRRPRWRWLGAGLALLLLGAIALGVGHFRAPAEAKPVYALKPLISLTDTPESRSLADALTARLASGLGGIPYISLIAPGAADMGAAGYTIGGTVQQGDAGAHVEAWITDPATGKVLASTRFDAPEREASEMQEEILGKVGDELCAAINQIYFLHPIDTPERQQAERLARQAVLIADHGDNSSEAISLLQQANAIDPENLDITGRLAILLVTTASNNFVEPQEAYLAEAEKILGRVRGKARWNRLISYANCEYNRVLGDLNKAVSACEETQKIQPWSPRTSKELAYVYQLQGALPDSLIAFNTSARLWRSGSIQWTWFYGAGLSNLLLDKNGNAVASLTAATILRSDSPAVHALLAAAYHRLGDETEAEREATIFHKLQGPVTVKKILQNLFPSRITYNADFMKKITALRNDMEALLDHAIPPERPRKD